MIAALAKLAPLTGQATLAALKWDPTIRGILFPGIMIVILCGGSYMIMATNMGNRLGFLVALTALVGWMFLMSIAWLLYGIGLKGPEPHWEVQEVITGNNLVKVAQYRPAAVLATTVFDDAKLCVNVDAIKGANDADTARLLETANDAAAKRRAAVAEQVGWRPICEGTPVRGDAQATVDANIVRSTADPAKTPLAVFTKANEYTPVAAWDRGGDNQLFTIGNHKFFPFHHSAHWFATVVAPVKTEITKTPVMGPGQVQAKDDAGAPLFKETTTYLKDATGRFVVDQAKPATTVLSLRDQGSKRKPPFILFIFSGAALAILLSVLHRRDKQVMAAMSTVGGRSLVKA